MSNLAPLALMIMGPTSTGKTQLAIDLLKRLPCEIISVDSAMVYRGMDIGTAKPSLSELIRAPHRLIDICDPIDAYSTARFREDALREMAQITEAGRIPLLVGGTMLYFQSLLKGLSPLPKADPDVRRQLDEEAAKLGWAAMHQQLAEIDPVTANRVHPNDPQRIQRALEIYRLTGRPMTELFAQKTPELPYRVIKMILAPQDRALLHQRIAHRYEQMLEAGLLAEVEGLYQRGDLNPDCPSIRAVGYRQLWSYLDGEMAYDEAVERAIIATRQLAKRQMTWLRKEEKGQWFDCMDKNLCVKALKYLMSVPILD